jgi:hypothetical protein
VLVFPPGTSPAPVPPAPLGTTGFDAAADAPPVAELAEGDEDAAPAVAGFANIEMVGISESFGPSPAPQPTNRASPAARIPHDGPGAIERRCVVTSGKSRWTLMAGAWRETTAHVECVSKDRGSETMFPSHCAVNWLSRLGTARRAGPGPGGHRGASPTGLFRRDALFAACRVTHCLSSLSQS